MQLTYRGGPRILEDYPEEEVADAVHARLGQMPLLAFVAPSWAELAQSPTGLAISYRLGCYWHSSVDECQRGDFLGSSPMIHVLGLKGMAPPCGDAHFWVADLALRVEEDGDDVCMVWCRMADTRPLE